MRMGIVFNLYIKNAAELNYFLISRFLVYTEKLLHIFKIAAELNYFLKEPFIKDTFYSKNVLLYLYNLWRKIMKKKV